MPFLSHPKKPNPKTPCIVHSLIENIASGNLKRAVDSLEIFRLKGLRLKTKTLAFLIRQCGNFRSLREGKRVHLHLKITGLKRPVVYISNHLINMYFGCGDSLRAQKVFNEMRVRNLYTWNNLLSGYAKLGKMESARRVFDEMPERDVVSWNSMLMGSARLGSIEDVLRFYRGLRFSGVGYNEFSFVGVFRVCIEGKELVLTRQVHGQVLVLGYYSYNVVVSSMAVDAYAKCGEMADARRVFEEMVVKDVLAWTTLLTGYIKQGDVKMAKEVFDQMQEKNSVSWNSLIARYATLAFELSSDKQEVAIWNTMISALTQHGHVKNAVEVFDDMVGLGLKPDQFTLVAILNACRHSGIPHEGLRLFLSMTQ